MIMHEAEEDNHINDEEDDYDDEEDDHDDEEDKACAKGASYQWQSWREAKCNPNCNCPPPQRTMSVFILEFWLLSHS